MEEWKLNVIFGIFALAVGICLLLFETTLTITSLKRTFLAGGMLFIGGGCGGLASAYTIYKLEKRVVPPK